MSTSEQKHPAAAATRGRTAPHRRGHLAHPQPGPRRAGRVPAGQHHGPTTRALFDHQSRVLWSVDSFAALTPGALHEHADMPADLYDETFRAINIFVSPWHQWLDPIRYGRHIDDLQRMQPVATASAHGPVLRGEAINDAFSRVRAMAGNPIVQPPGAGDPR